MPSSACSSTVSKNASALGVNPVAVPASSSRRIASCWSGGSCANGAPDLAVAYASSAASPVV